MYVVNLIFDEKRARTSETHFQVVKKENEEAGTKSSPRGLTQR